MSSPPRPCRRTWTARSRSRCAAWTRLRARWTPSARRDARATSGPPPRPSRPDSAGRGSNAAELAGGERASSSKKAFQRLRDEDAPSRDDASAAKKHKRRAERDSKDSKSGLEEREERELKLERASPTKTVVVSETKDGTRAPDAALASETDASTDASIGSASVSTDLSALNVLEPVQWFDSDQSGVERSLRFRSRRRRRRLRFRAATPPPGRRCSTRPACRSAGSGASGRPAAASARRARSARRGSRRAPRASARRWASRDARAAALRRRRLSGWVASGKAEATTATNDFDGGVPVDVASRVVAAPAALTTEGAVRASPERSTRPDEAEARPPRRRRRRRRLPPRRFRWRACRGS